MFALLLELFSTTLRSIESVPCSIKYAFYRFSAGVWEWRLLSKKSQGRDCSLEFAPSDLSTSWKSPDGVEILSPLFEAQVCHRLHIKSTGKTFEQDLLEEELIFHNHSLYLTWSNLDARELKEFLGASIPLSAYFPARIAAFTIYHPVLHPLFFPVHLLTTPTASFWGLVSNGATWPKLEILDGSSAK